uniref:Pentacotripeptide-repeat region of PRORP domain-containing protein n=1 Tax=Attheya septentrionalis TaxID=420275 RepID=A0A7S2URA9_9STRA|mmetsp:Transcript_9111/g.16559  ORF Transcript_9111/g.16559 Transcript_9111/m.16559 type:complete len:930 (+) Transcript_9111:217-3006(+)
MGLSTMNLSQWENHRRKWVHDRHVVVLLIASLLFLVSRHDVAVEATFVFSVRPAYRRTNTGVALMDSRRGKKEGASSPVSILSSTSSKNAGSSSNAGRAKTMAHDTRRAIRWVVESTEKLEPGDNDAQNPPPMEPLLSALHRLHSAGSQRDLTEAGRKIEYLCQEYPDYSLTVQERVMKATALAGLVHITMDIFQRSFIGRSALPSSMSYIALLQTLRRMRKVNEMRQVLVDLGNIFRQNHGKQTNDDDENNHRGVHTTALNIYLAALCDASIYRSNMGGKSRERGSVTNALSNNDSNSDINETEKCQYFREALDLLQPNAAHETFAIESEPDLRSYNTVLNAAATAGRMDMVNNVLALLYDRDEYGKGDIYTYNARLKATVSTTAYMADTDVDPTLAVYDELFFQNEKLSLDSILPDKYTINLVLVPLIQAKRLEETLRLLGDLVNEYGDIAETELSNAFAAFLTTLVKANELDAAESIFETFLLPAKSKPRPSARHFNVLINAYCSGHKKKKRTTKNDDARDSSQFDSIFLPSSTDSNTTERAMQLFDTMLGMDIQPDVYTVSSLMSFQSKSEGITRLWKQAALDLNIQLTDVVYRSIISAYIRANDASSACWAFAVMYHKLGSKRRSIQNWNALLNVFAKCSISGVSSTLAISSSSAAVHGPIQNDEFARILEQGGVSHFLEGLTFADASRFILNGMAERNMGSKNRNESEGTQEKFDKEDRCGLEAPLPDSQSYCLVASTMSHDRTSVGSGTDAAIDLFRSSQEAGIPPDGRFLNAIFRCFQDDIEGAIQMWKTEIGQAVRVYERRRSQEKQTVSRRRDGQNIIAAYHGLFHVCGRANRPDMALRLVYAMAKEGMDASETSLNCYMAGKGEASKEPRDEKEKRSLKDKSLAILAEQYESLLTIECSKYSKNDRRRFGEKTVRIIL